MSHTRFKIRLWLVVLLANIFAAGAQAEWTKDADQCARIADNHDLAIYHCSRAIKSNLLARQELARTYANRGYEYYEIQQYERGLNDAMEAVRLDDSIPGTWGQLGNGHKHLRNYRKAIAAYQEALNRLDSAGETTVGLGIELGAHLSMGWCYEQLGDRGAARRHYGLAYEIDPNNPAGTEYYRRFGFIE